jgi:glycosyltransferase involved in cell wall biosynthesis
MLGPVVKIDPVDLPQRPNIHFLGMKKYAQLPSYIGGWDVAILPFARNEATRFISPTKTPEYLAAGRPVVSTSIRDVVNPYGDLGLAHIADDASAFVAAIEAALAEDPQKRLKQVDIVLSQNSWARTWGRMAELIDDLATRKNAWPAKPVPRHAYARAASAAGASSGS